MSKKKFCRIGSIVSLCVSAAFFVWCLTEIQMIQRIVLYSFFVLVSAEIVFLLTVVGDYHPIPTTPKRLLSRSRFFCILSQ